MHNLLVTLLAYVIDRVFGEFRFIKHPIIIIGELISFLEKQLYKKSVMRGFLLVVSVLSVVGGVIFSLEYLLLLLPLWLNTLLTALIASMFIAHNMLKSAVLEVLEADDKREAIAMLVSRDTQDLSESDIYKACIETYAENLSDGVVAPLLYLLFFGLPGIVLYKTINTMDSMLGYRNERYEKFGKVAARLDDVANYIPARVSAVLIMFFAKQKNIFAFYSDGKKHESPNAGHPITAMAYVLEIALGGDTRYFGKVKKKPYFGNGRKEISKSDVQKAVKLL